MNHIKNILIKFISTLALLYIVLGMFYEMSFRNVFLISLVLGILSYILGDMLILRGTNNTMATISDFILSFAVIWFMGQYLTFGDGLFSATLISSLGIALFEYFFHKYVARQSDNHTTTTRNQTQSSNLRYQTEASKEFDPRNKD